MGKRRYNTLDEILEGYNAGDISLLFSLALLLLLNTIALGD